MQVRQAREQYVRWLRITRELSPHTVRAHEGDIATFERHVGARALVGPHRWGCLLAFIEAQRAAGLAPSSIRRRASGLRGFCRWLLAAELLELDPWVGRTVAAGRARELPRVVAWHDLERARAPLWLCQDAGCLRLPVDSGGFWSWGGWLGPNCSRVVASGLADRCAVRQSLPPMSLGAAGQFDRLLREIREARAQLPAEHRNLLAQIGTQEGVVEDWPTGVQDLFRSVQEMPPSDAALVNAAAVWLDGLRTVVFNGPLMQAATTGLTDASRKQLVAYIAWHEYGHALSLTRSTHEQRRSGVRLLGLLSDGMRASIDYPAGYGRLQVFDEIIATVYALLISRIRTDGYGVPEFLHPEIVQAFKEVIPWPPSQ